MTEVLGLLGVSRAVVFGWSLGGHIGLEMIGRFPGMLGLMITGTPPVSPAEVGNGFKPSPHMGLAAKEIFTVEDVENYARSTCGEPFEPFCSTPSRAPTAGRPRLMFEKFAAGTGRDQSEIVAGKTPPIAVLNGIDEPFVNTDFVDAVKFSNLWEGKSICSTDRATRRSGIRRTASTRSSTASSSSRSGDRGDQALPQVAGIHHVQTVRRRGMGGKRGFAPVRLVCKGASPSGGRRPGGRVLGEPCEEPIPGTWSSPA